MFLELTSKGLHQSSGKQKRKLLSFVPVLDKTWNWAVSRCSRATTAKKCTKKRDARAKLLFCLSKLNLLLFCRSRCRRRRRCVNSLSLWLIRTAQLNRKTLLKSIPPHVVKSPNIGLPHPSNWPHFGSKRLGVFYVILGLGKHQEKFSARNWVWITGVWRFESHWQQ